MEDSDEELNSFAHNAADKAAVPLVDSYVEQQMLRRFGERDAQHSLTEALSENAASVVESNADDVSEKEVGMKESLSTATPAACSARMSATNNFAHIPNKAEQDNQHFHDAQCVKTLAPPRASTILAECETAVFNSICHGALLPRCQALEKLLGLDKVTHPPELEKRVWEIKHKLEAW